MKKFEILSFPKFSDSRGDLFPFELDEKFPFPVRRVYLATSRDDHTRGGHAHKIESEVFVAASGSITARVNDGGGSTDQEIVLDSPQKALLVRRGCWHEFSNFAPGSVLLAFSSTHYLPGDENYIRDRAEFLKLSGDGQI